MFPKTFIFALLRSKCYKNIILIAMPRMKPTFISSIKDTQIILARVRVMLVFLNLFKFKLSKCSPTIQRNYDVIRFV